MGKRCCCLLLLPVLLFFLLSPEASSGDALPADPAGVDADERVYRCLDWEYTLDGDGHATLTRWMGMYRAYDEGENEVWVPELLEEHPVTAIGTAAFALRSPGRVIIPEGITAIGPRAFQYAWVTEVEIPSSVVSIGSSAFAYCEGLTRLVIPEGVAELGEQLCLGCPDLAEVSLPGSAREVPRGCFSECPRLRRVILGEGIRALGEGVFPGCEQLETLYIPASLEHLDRQQVWWRTLKAFHLAPENPYFTLRDGMLLSADGTLLLAWPGRSEQTVCHIPEQVVSIEAGAFQEAEHLTEVTFPSTLVEIGAAAFQDCSALTRVVLPEGVALVGDGAFCGCSALETIVLPGSLWEIGAYAFPDDPWSPRVSVPRTYDAPPGSYAYQWLINHNILPLTPDAG